LSDEEGGELMHTHIHTQTYTNIHVYTYTHIYTHMPQDSCERYSDVLLVVG